MTSPTTWATYADSLQANLQFASAKKVDAGVQTLQFAGQDMIFSHKYTSDTVWGLNTKETKLYVIKEFYRQRRSEIELPNAATMTMKIVSMAQIATKNRSRNFACFT